MDYNMFCYQCQETAGNSGCTRVGVCGKRPSVSNLQDLLVYVTKGLSAVTTRLRKEGMPVSGNVNHLVTFNLFVTITNANFDEDFITDRIIKTLEQTQLLLRQLKDTSDLPDASTWYGAVDTFTEKAAESGILSSDDDDINSLRALITYGLKGLSAYTKHANALLQDSEKLDAFIQRALADTLDDELTVPELVDLTLEVGRRGVEGMALLDKANTDAYGNPEITNIRIDVGTRPGILVSGHDLRDLEMLLEQSKDSGIDIYTHSEMLPANSYPAFKKYHHFYGNYGGSWWKQKEEFEAFHGPILMTTKFQLSGSHLQHWSCGLSWLPLHSGRNRRRERFLGDHRARKKMPTSGATGKRHDYRRFRPCTGLRTRRPDRRRRPFRCHTQIRRHGRMRRTF